MTNDLSFRKNDFAYSHRVAGILELNGKILLQSVGEGDKIEYAFPGGHPHAFETGADALKREFMEETGIEIEVGALRWVGDIFYLQPNGEPCHQICLYFDVMPTKDGLSTASFSGMENYDYGEGAIDFSWLDKEAFSGKRIYPMITRELVTVPRENGVQYFVADERDI